MRLIKTVLKKNILFLVILLSIITTATYGFGKERETNKTYSQSLDVQHKTTSISLNKNNESLPQLVINTQNKKDNQLWGHIFLANGYVKNNQISNAIKEYEFVLSKKFYEKVASNLVYLLILNGNEKKLEHIINKYKLYQNQKIFIKAIIFLLKFRNFSKAQKFLKEDCVSNNKYICLYLRGLFYERTEDLDKALDFYTKAYKLRSNNDLIAYSYARILDIQKKYKQAIDIYKRILKNNINDSVSCGISNNIKKVVRSRLKLLEVYNIGAQ